ncbi:MAG: type II secretion system major pseudopilin GspG [Proteobacteria bacterium]|nr:type II secretion system major pseudopilin GspG [Pseudomonadota bacterium]
MMDSNKKRSGQQGFTMIELLLVMVILGMLAALVGPNLIGQAGKARSKAARVQIANLGTALDTYALDVGRYPSGAEGLEGLRDRPSGLAMWDGPYLPKKVPMDPWGNQYQYQEPSTGGLYTITSYGSDGRAGGEGDAADITNLD